MEALVILALVLGNGFFSMSEFAVVSARRPRLESWALEGRRGAKEALHLADHPEHFISAAQFGMTLMGILAGAFGGATLATHLATYLHRFKVIAPYSETLGFLFVVAPTTYLTLILGELAPKQYALLHAERIACIVSKPMRIFAQIATPAVVFFSRSAALVLRLFGSKPSQEPPVTEEELRILIEQATRHGVFEESEREMLEGVLRLKDRCAGDLITPRAEIVWLDLEAAPEQTLAVLRAHSFSAFPLCRGKLDEVMGVVNSKDLLALCLAGGELDPKKAQKPPLFVPENRNVPDLLASFRETGQHLAIVLDEYGGVNGLVTANDIAASIVGALPFPGESEKPEAVRREDGSWLLDGLLPTDEMRDLLHLPESAFQGGAYRTVGGLVMAELGKVPIAGDHFTWAGLRIEVVDMDGKRVDKVLIQDLRGTG